MALKIAVTGGNGFIGREIVRALLDRDANVVSYQRSAIHAQNVEIQHFDLTNLTAETLASFAGVDVIIHAAALVHKPSAEDAAYEALNFEATRILIDTAKSRNVKKFVFLSTVGVYGASSSIVPLDISSPTNPINPYAKSKLSAEEYLLSQSGAIAISIFRLPLVYGPQAPGNYGALEKLTMKKWPLPFSGVRNKRSMIDVKIASQVIAECAMDKEAHIGLHLLSEAKPFSTEGIMVKIRQESEMPKRLFVFLKSL